MLKLTINTFYHVLTATLIVAAFSAHANTSKPAFELYDAHLKRNQKPASIEYVTATDGVKLAYRLYPSQSPAKAVLIFYHSTGTHSAITYPSLAQSLTQDYPIAVITPDMRGHGYSKGPRGDTTSSDSMYEDVNNIIQLARTRYPGSPVFIGGHSSGAGLVINHSSYNQAEKVDGYIFLSPYMGVIASVMREGISNDFIEIDFKPFIKNAKDGSNAHTLAVTYHFPDNVIEQFPRIVTKLSVEMSLATNAQWPYHQLRDIQQPIAMWVGEQDEGLDPKKLTYFLQNANERAEATVLPEQNHMTVILNAYKHIGPWLLSNAQ